MPLSDHLPPAAPKGPPCTVGTTLAALDDTDRAILNGWLHDRGVSAARIYQAITAAADQWASEGDELIVPGVSAIERHSRGLCLCRRSVTYRG